LAIAASGPDRPRAGRGSPALDMHHGTGNSWNSVSESA
jgi:hypothetical protein